MANTIMYGRRSIDIVPDGITDIDIATMQSPRLPLGSVSGDFTVGETVYQATSDAFAVVARWDRQTMNLFLSQMTGTFDSTNVVTGATGGATGIPSEVAGIFQNGIRVSAVDLKPSRVGDTLVIREKTATGAFIYMRGDSSGGGIHKSTGGRSLRVKPYIAVADQTWATPGDVVIMLEID